MTAPARSAEELNRVTSAIIAAAIDIHRTFGSGLLESAYAKCLAVDLEQAGFHCAYHQPVPLVYKGRKIGYGYVADLIVDGSVIVEVKALESITAVHERQLQTYLRLANCRVGLLLNFGAAVLKDGIKRRVNDFPSR